MKNWIKKFETLMADVDPYTLIEVFTLGFTLVFSILGVILNKTEIWGVSWILWATHWFVCTIKDFKDKRKYKWIPLGLTIAMLIIGFIDVLR